MGSLSAALAPEATRFPAVLTLTATASGLTLFGIGSAFWGLVLGLLALGLDKLAKKIKIKKRIKKGLMQPLLSGEKRLKGFNEPWKIVKLSY